MRSTGPTTTGDDPVAKLDLKQARKALFTAPKGEFVPIVVPRVLYLMAGGHGDPNAAPEYARAVAALYSTAYALKFGCKAQGRDFVVAPLEGLWSAADPSSFVARRKSEWDWTMLIMAPDFVDEAAFESAREKARAKLGELPPSLRLEALEEGLSLQALHIGSYDDEGPLLARLHDEIMPAGGYTFAGPHHEIYLGDPRKTAPEKLKTILRQPVRKAG
jgi:hypothetical protein